MKLFKCDLCGEIYEHGKMVEEGDNSYEAISICLMNEDSGFADHAFHADLCPKCLNSIFKFDKENKKR